MINTRRYITKLTILSLVSMLPQLCFAGFNVYDARTLGMGNTSVAVASTDIAYFYNPSILAFHYEDEDKTRDGRFLAPTIVAQFSSPMRSAYDLIDQELDTRFNDAIDVYNASPGSPEAPANAARAGNLARRVNSIVDDVKGKDLTVDSYFGMGFSEVGELGGGSFFLGSRVLGGGEVAITPEDEVLFDQYIGALDYISGGGTDCASNPDFTDILNPDCSLADPDGRFTSIASFRGAVIGEAGVSMAKLYTWKDFMIAVGASPKVMVLQAIDENRQFSEEDNLDIITETESHFFLNVDAGITIDYKERYRLGFAIKDILRKSFATSLDNRLFLGPSARIGFSYLHPRFTIGADYDLNKEESFAGEAQRQDFSIGTEIKLFSLTHLRLGYRTDTLSNYENVSSIGFGFGWRYLFIESAYATGKNQESFALQLGFTF